ncbi:MAG TPA: DUF3147 family protein [Nitrospira sp.]|nr:DUF3147 family protein [Nitrospira sp.]
MNISVSLSGLAQTKPLEFALRFVFGGIVTALAGLIAAQFGPVVGGIFLAFPSIFPATATLIEKHEAKKKKQEGMHGRYLAKCAAGADAAGAAMGTIGLLAFGMLVWQLSESVAPWIVLTTATIAWFAVSMTVWIVRKRF